MTTLASIDFQLSNAVRGVLAILSHTPIGWARFKESAQRFDVTVQTTVCYGKLNGFCIRMWPSLTPEGLNATVFVGGGAPKSLVVELWGDITLESHVAPSVDDRPEEALVLFESATGGVADVFEAAKVVEEVLKRSYEAFGGSMA
jgi:hypothetical protein